MSLSKQAKTLTKGQIDAVLGYLDKTLQSDKEPSDLPAVGSSRSPCQGDSIADLGHGHRVLTAPSGKPSGSRDIASKGRSGRVIPLSRELRETLSSLCQNPSRGSGSRFLIKTERSTHPSPQVIVNLFCQWYQALGFNGCSSHSGRRTFITNAARKISTVGGSLRDVQILPGHSNLTTTQRYIESDADAQRKIVELV